MKSLISNDICERCMKSRIWTYKVTGFQPHTEIHACKFCYILWMKESYTKMYLESWEEPNYNRIQTNEKYCVVGSLMNIVKIKARLQYMGE